MTSFKYDKLESIKAKKKTNKIQIIRNVYKNCFAPSNVIGRCITLCEKHKPTSCEDFEEKYHKYAQENINLPIKERGLTKDELLSTVKKFKQKCEEIDNSLNYDEKTYYDTLICHIITETYYGYLREQLLMNYINNIGLQIKKSSYKEDAKKSIDFIVNNNDEEYYIQVKPLSFFKGLHYTDTYRDNQKMVDNAIYLSNNENKKFYVCIYEIDEENGVVKWVKNDNKICHEINHIYNLTESNIIIDLKFLSEDRLVM